MIAGSVILFWRVYIGGRCGDVENERQQNRRDGLMITKAVCRRYIPYELSRYKRRKAPLESRGRLGTQSGCGAFPEPYFSRGHRQN